MSTRKAEQVSRRVQWHKSIPGDPLIHYTLRKYGDYECLNGQLIVTAACASFVLKGEDKHTVVYDEEGLEDCQNENDPHVPLLLAFCGVFDGHGGHLASSYCSTGLLPHVLTETADCITKQRQRQQHPASRNSSKSSAGKKASATSPVKMSTTSATTESLLAATKRYPSLSALRYHASESLRALDNSQENHQAQPSKQRQSSTLTTKTTDITPLECGFVNAFHRAHERFGKGSDPPDLTDVTRGKKYTRSQQDAESGCLGAICHRAPPIPRGGTTACTLAIYAERSKLGDAYRPIPYALVANCGDSRLITDDGTGGSNFRQVTVDHRPVEPSERARLQHAKNVTDISVREDPHEEPHPIPRLFPGGLAVSRTIGDLHLTKAAIPTPDMYRVPLHVSKEETSKKHETHQRFVLGTDGLFDVLTNEEVGKLAARVQSTSNDTEADDGEVDVDTAVVTSTRDATVKVMDHCLKYAKNFDDINLLVVDVVYYGDEEAHHHG